MKFEIDEIREKMSLESMGAELRKKGIIFESDFDMKITNFYDDNIVTIMELLKEETDLNIMSYHDVCYFSFYDTNRYTLEMVKKAMREHLVEEIILVKFKDEKEKSGVIDFMEITPDSLGIKETEFYRALKSLEGKGVIKGIIWDKLGGCLYDNIEIYTEDYKLYDDVK